FRNESRTGIQTTTAHPSGLPPACPTAGFSTFSVPGPFISAGSLVQLLGGHVAGAKGPKLVLLTVIERDAQDAYSLRVALGDLRVEPLVKLAFKPSGPILADLYWTRELAGPHKTMDMHTGIANPALTKVLKAQYFGPH